MGTLIGTYKNMIIILFIITIISIAANYVWNLKSNIKQLNEKLTLTETKLIQEKANSQTLTGAIVSQNNEIEKHKVNYEANLTELEKWKNQPAEIKYKDVIKYKEVKSNECKDIKMVINNIRSTSF